MIAKIAVSAAIYAIDKPYSYRIPAGMQPPIGARVSVPFGRSNKRCEGIVLGLETGDDSKLKPIDRLLDETPLLDEELLHMAAFVRERYFCTFYEAVKAILPAGVWFREQERYFLCESAETAEIRRQPAAEAVLNAVRAFGGAADYDALRKQFEEDALQKALRYLLKKRLLRCETDHKRRVQDKTERIVSLAMPAEEALAYAQSKRKSAPLQTAVLELIASVGQCAAKEICYFTGATAATLNRLEKLGFLEFSEEERLRISRVEPAKLDGPLLLNDEQQLAYDGLKAQSLQEKPGVALLYGVTGSGKTSVYIKLIYDCLSRGRSAMLLVPEIALTPQLLSLFAAHFGEKTAVLHSSLRITERYDTWKRIRSGDATVILGTRSAVFAPVKNLGLLIVDEEQEHTYKSENAPRYHAREIAIYRGARTNALVLLGSATPSVETMYRAKTGVYRFYEMRRRYNRKELPPVEIVDMKQELKEGNASAISEPLLLALRENRERGQQAILFLNRRGTSRMVACVDCGFVPTCPGCTVNLTYHQANGRLMCHYCGHSELLPAHCPECGGHLKQIGFGTQKVQEQLNNLLPEAEVLRMDADTVSAVNTHEKLLSRFREERIPILLGTQMVAKGLNFENVTLVGVLDADMSLYVGSYRAAETTFSMITQVIGRAGRGAENGRALIQTMTPQNQVITLAAKQDYDTFYETELPLRKLRGCPPYRDLLTLTFHGREDERVWQSAQRFRAMLQAQLESDFYRREQVQLMGPAPAQVAKLNYSYRCCLTLSCKNTRSLRELLAHMMRAFSKDKQNNGVGVFADVNRNE
ncbi:MAG: primosomal protein N' [Oscillospiraceae bacterium]|nr:primosomal protein N' [Oscillospiraceae bacterium]